MSSIRVSLGIARRSSGLEARTALYSALGGGSAFLASVVIARQLGPSGRGEFAAMYVPIVLAAPLAALGMGNAVVFWSASDPARRIEYERTAAYVSACASTATSLVLGFTLYLALDTGLAALLCLYLPMYAVHGVLANAFRGRLDFRSWNVHRTVPTVILPLGLTVALVAIGGLEAVVLAYLFGGAVSIIAVAIALRPTGAWKSQSNAERQPTDSSHSSSVMLRFGLPSALSDLLNGAALRLDQLLILAVAPRDQVGIYAVAVSWANIMAIIASALGKPTSAKVAQLDADQRRSAGIPAIKRSVALVALAAGVMLPLTPLLPQVFGTEFSEARLCAGILVVAAGVAAINTVSGEISRGMGQPITPIFSEATSLATTAIFFFPLTLHFGITGAAITSLVAYTAGTVVLLIRLNRSRNTPSDKSGESTMLSRTGPP